MLLILILLITFKIYQKIRVPEGLKNVATLSFLDLAIALLASHGLDKRWEDMREVLEKDGIGKVI